MSSASAKIIAIIFFLFLFLFSPLLRQILLCEGFSAFKTCMGIVYLMTVIGRTAREMREGRVFLRRELPSNCVEVKVVWMGMGRFAFERFLLKGIVSGESSEWLLAVVEMEILLGVPVMQLVDHFLQVGLG